MTTIEVKSTPQCQKCAATMRMLKKNGLQYHHTFITDNDLKKYKDQHGLSVAPIVVVTPDSLEKLAHLRTVNGVISDSESIFWSDYRPTIMRDVMKIVKEEQ